MLIKQVYISTSDGELFLRFAKRLDWSVRVLTELYIQDKVTKEDIKTVDYLDSQLDILQDSIYNTLKLLPKEDKIKYYKTLHRRPKKSKMVNFKIGSQLGRKLFSILKLINQLQILTKNTFFEGKLEKKYSHYIDQLDLMISEKKQ